MFQSKTVIVLGAAASLEIGMPLGIDLIKEISERLNNIIKLGISTGEDHRFMLALREHDIDVQEALSLFQTMLPALAHASSIDGYLHARGDNSKIIAIGKTMLASILLEKEKNSSIFISHKGTEFYKKDVALNSWFGKFFKLLHSRINRSNLDEIFSNISIISFNYDRCIKQFLHRALMDYYQLDKKDAALIINNLEIIYPYGTLGHLEWEIGKDENSCIKFGDTNVNLKNITNSIYTFDESISDIGGIKTRISKSLRLAKKAIFIGFAYHSQNIDLLDCSARNPYEHISIYGTSYGISPQNSGYISTQLKEKMNSSTPQLSPHRCSEFFDIYNTILTSK